MGRRKYQRGKEVNAMKQGQIERCSEGKKCQICGTTKSKCGYLGEDLIMCFSDPIAPEGWKRIKSLKEDMGGLFLKEGAEINRNLSNTQNYRKPKPKTKEFKEPETKEEKERRDEELNKLYRIIAKENSLSDFHKNKLKERGLSVEQIEALERKGFYSHLPNRKTSIKKVIPGAKNQRLTGKGGVFIPAYTGSGKIVSGQIWQPNNKSTKYCYLPGGTGKEQNYLPENIKLRKKQGPPQTVAIPSFTKKEIKLEKAALHIHQGIAKIYDENGVYIKGASKEIKNVRNKELETLSLGLQLCLEIGIGKIIIFGINKENKNFLLDNSASAIKELCNELLTTQKNYEISDIELTKETKLNHLKNEEKFVDVVDFKEVLVVEGVLKPFIAAEKLRKVCIGCPGGQHNSSPDLEENLKLLNPQKIIFCPDAGDIMNKSNVPTRSKKSIEKIENLGFDVVVAWWGQATKEENDIDEITQKEFEAREELSLEEYIDKHPRETKRVLKNEYTKCGLQKVTSGKTPNHPRRTKKIKNKPTTHKKGEKKEILKHLLQANQVIGDVSYTGSGKSKAFSELEPKDFSVEKIFHISEEPLSIEENFREWAQYRGRDNGRKLREDRRIVRSGLDSKEKKYLPKNCEKIEEVENLTKRNLIPKTNGKPCMNCEFLNTCKTTKGWYLSDREQTLQASKIRMHPKAINASTIPEEKSLFIFDDCSPFVENYSISFKEIQSFHRIFGGILNQIAPDLEEKIEKLLILCNKNEIIYNKEIKDHLKELKENEEELEVLFQLEKQKLEQDTLQETYYKESPSELGKVWFKDFVESLNSQDIYLYIYNNALFINKLNKTLLKLIEGGHKIILADATGQPEDWRRWLRLKESIPTIEQERKENKNNNLRIIQLTGLGDLGFNRSDRQKNELQKVKSFLKEFKNYPSIEIKKEAEKEDLKWLSTNRGSNAVKDAEGLILIGTPRKNIASTKANYCLMAQRTPDEGEARTAYPLKWANSENWIKVLKEPEDFDFSEYQHQQTLAEIYQGIGRLRAARRQDEKLEVIVINEYPLDLEGVEAYHYSQFIKEEESPSKNDPIYLSREEIETAANLAITIEGSLTQEILSEYLSVKRSAIADFFRIPGRDWKSFKESILEKAQNPDEVNGWDFVEESTEHNYNSPTKTQVSTSRESQPSESPINSHTEEKPTKATEIQVGDRLEIQKGKFGVVSKISENYFLVDLVDDQSGEITCCGIPVPKKEYVKL